MATGAWSQPRRRQGCLRRRWAAWGGALGVLALGVGVAVSEEPAPRADASFWSFQPVREPTPPPVRHESWVRTPIDRFILAKLEENKLVPAPEASKETLLRRVTYDLTGLPPRPAEIQAFLEDSSPDAWEKVIDRLLASRQYGERWGRHWLDVARYADTAGESADYPIPQAYRYRNYVIEAFNRDTPYNQFLREQIAGDLLPAASEEEKQKNIVATGFIALSRRFGVDPDATHYQTIEDTLDTLGRATMGMSLSCARCHDHKFDPISSQDYYALYGIFSSTKYPFPGSENKKRQRDLTPLLSEEEYARVMEPFQEEFAVLDRELDALNEENKRAAQVERGQKVDGPPPRTKLQLLEAFRAVRARRDAVQDRMPPIPMAYAVSEGKPANTRVQKRGEPFNLGEEVPRGFLTVLGGQKLPSETSESGRRELAEWIVDPRNPLTARVIVNRLWQHHFGRGLVATPNDFGQMGQPPTHPELLDWLASQFVKEGWSIKKMHRLILQSATWRQSSTSAWHAAMEAHAAPTAATSSLQADDELQVTVAVAPTLRNPELVDPSNSLLARFPRLRLDAEMTRDALLFTSGQLDPLPGGPHPFPPPQEWHWTQHNPFVAVYETKERSVYVMQQRIRRHPFFAAFDGADTNASTGARFITTTPLQALFLMNDGFVHEQAASLAQRMRVVSASDVRRIDFAYRLLYGRRADSDETALGIIFLANARATLPKEAPEEQRDQQAWASYARVLLSANEFVYLD